MKHIFINSIPRQGWEKCSTFENFFSRNPKQNVSIFTEHICSVSKQNIFLREHMSPGSDFEKPYQRQKAVECKICKKWFKNTFNHQVQLRVQSGVKPFRCGVCKKCFSIKSNRNRHLKIHTSETPYVCQERRRGKTGRCVSEEDSSKPTGKMTKVNSYCRILYVKRKP